MNLWSCNKLSVVLISGFGIMPDAESQAMRRAAARFGLGLYLYDKAIINAIKKRI